MNETTRHPNRRQRLAIATLINGYQPPRKRKIPTVKSWEELTALAANPNPPSKVILNLNGEKIELTLKRGLRCL